MFEIEARHEPASQSRATAAREDSHHRFNQSDLGELVRMRGNPVAARRSTVPGPLTRSPGDILDVIW